MRRFWLLCLCCGALFGGARAAGARHRFYVSGEGDDGSEGSKAHPWKRVEAVNRVKLEPGDSVFFRGGDLFKGTLRIGGSGTAGFIGGSAARPAFVGSYGDGDATIDGGDSSAVVLYRAHWLVVKGLRLVGAGRKTGNVKDGLGVIECAHVRIEDIDVTGFQKSGLFIYTSKEIVALRVVAHENGAAGIAVEGPFNSKKGAANIKILECRSDDNPGDPTNLTNHSGNGIVCGHVTGLLIDRCSATNNGWDMPRIGNGPVGIWCYESDSVVIQHCLAYRNKTSAGGADGGGFDLDGGVTHSVIQYCLSYGNQGSGYCIFQYWGASPWHDNVVRWNISEDDGLVSDSRAGMYVWNSSGDSNQFYNCKVYNNTVYDSKEAALSFSSTSARKGFTFYNNIFVGADSLIRGNRGVDVFRNNDWWVLNGSDGHSDKPGDRGIPGRYVKPAFRDPGGTTVTDVQALVGYDKYRLTGQGGGGLADGSGGLKGIGANW